MKTISILKADLQEMENKQGFSIINNDGFLLVARSYLRVMGFCWFTKEYTLKMENEYETYICFSLVKIDTKT